MKEIISRSSVAVRITVAEDVEKALALLRDPLFKPDLVITDMRLPKTNGADVLKWCNEGGVPLVVFSGSKDPADKVEAIRLGAKEFIEKPPDLDGYTEAVWRMIWTWIKPLA
jgi:DNA-binding NtrC family response regulator